MENKLSILNGVLKGLMDRYSERVPDVKGVTEALKKENVLKGSEEIENDHIAFRTMGVPQLGVKSLEKIFLHYGYIKKDHYYFQQKKLDAWWYAPPQPHYPRIFISELRVQELSENAQRVIKNYTDEVKSDPVDNLNLDDASVVDNFLHSALWRLPSWEDYQLLASESEYAAWVIYNRYYLNHFTISVHNLKEGYNTIEQFNAFLERNGFVLNNSGGKIKASPDGGLLQSSTVAAMVPATFAGGVEKMISGSYVEFAERKILPQFASLPKGEIKTIHRRDGFEAGNADKIFESTYTSQTSRSEGNK